MTIRFENHFELWAMENGKEIFRYRSPNLVTMHGLDLARFWFENTSAITMYMGLMTTRPGTLWEIRTGDSATVRKWREVNAIPNSFFRPIWVPDTLVEVGSTLTIKNGTPLEFPSWATPIGTIAYDIRGIFVSGSSTLLANTPYPDFLSSSTTPSSGMPHPLFEAKIATPFFWDFNTAAIILYATYEINYIAQGDP